MLCDPADPPSIKPYLIGFNSELDRSNEFIELNEKPIVTRS